MHCEVEKTEMYYGTDGNRAFIQKCSQPVGRSSQQFGNKENREPVNQDQVAGYARYELWFFKYGEKTEKDRNLREAKIIGDEITEEIFN